MDCRFVEIEPRRLLRYTWSVPFLETVVTFTMTPDTTGDWRAATLDRMRELIVAADPEMIEERKWKKASNAMAGVPVWSHDGIVCTGETYKNVVKLTFARGASLADPSHLFNSGLEGGTRRAIDISEGEEVNARAFKELVKAAVAQNGPPVTKATRQLDIHKNDELDETQLAKWVKQAAAVPARCLSRPRAVPRRVGRGPRRCASRRRSAW